VISRKNIIRILINTLIGLVLVLIWSRFINLDEVLEALKTIQPHFLIGCFIFYGVSGLLRSLRLKLFLKKFNLPLKDLIFLNYLSQFLSFTIPIRAGEIAKGVYLSSTGKMPFAQGLLFAFLDRFIDFWVNVLLLTVLILVIPVGITSNIRLGLVVILVGFSLATLIILSSQNLAKKMVPFRFAHSIIEGFDVFRRSPLELLVLLFLSALTILSDAVIFYFALISLGIDIGFVKTLISNLLFALTFLIPAAPGYVGNVEAGAVAILSGIMGVESNLASAAALVYHILNLVMVPLYGVVSLYLLKFDLRLVFKRLQRR
jgi:uncharacterized protein (TIRG00374 family)